MQGHDPHWHMPPKSTRTAPDLTTRAAVGVATSRPVVAVGKWITITLGVMCVAYVLPSFLTALVLIGFVAYIAYRVYRRIAATQYARVAHRDEATWAADYTPDQPMSSPAPSHDSPNPWG